MKKSVLMTLLICIYMLYWNSNAAHADGAVFLQNLPYTAVDSHTYTSAISVSRPNDVTWNYYCTDTLQVYDLGWGFNVSCPSGYARVEPFGTGYDSGDITVWAAPRNFTPSYIAIDAAHTLTSVDIKDQYNSSVIFERNLAFPLFSFPLHLNDYTAYTAPISSVFDHSGSTQYSDSDHYIVDFAGESSDVQTPYTGSTCYAKSDNSAFGSGFNYVGTSSTGGSYYLCYNGHPGTDYPVANNTPVYAAADGIAHIPSSFPGVSSAQTFNTVEIDHQNGYKTYYLHLSSQNVSENQQVYKGQTIIGYTGDTGASGAYHLHFEVQKDLNGNGVPVDPYGWAGGGTDPYMRARNIDLWE